MRRRRTGRTLPAYGGPRPCLELVEPLTSLARFEKSFSLTCARVVGELLRMEQIELAKNMPTLGLLRLVLSEAPLQVVRDANVSFAGIPFENIKGNPGFFFSHRHVAARRRIVEAAGMRRRRTGRTLPALGGPLPH